MRIELSSPGTERITIEAPSGAQTCILLMKHGVCIGASIIRGSKQGPRHVLDSAQRLPAPWGNADKMNRSDLDNFIRLAVRSTVMR